MTRSIKYVVLAVAAGALCVAGLFGGCAAGAGSSDDDDDGTATGAGSTPTGVGASAGSGGQAAAGGQVGGTGGQGALGGAGGGGNLGGQGGAPGPCGYGQPVCMGWDFDAACPAGWIGSGNNSDWQCGAPTWAVTDDCEGGGNVWATALHDNANTCQSSYLTSPAIDLSAYAGKTVFFGFYHSYDFRECSVPSLCLFPINTFSYSGGAIEVNSGSGWTPIEPEGGYENPGLQRIECSDGSGGSPSCGGAACDLDDTQAAYTSAGIELQWHQTLVNISSHLTSTFQLRFVYGSGEDDPIVFKNRAGWYLDNFAILASGTCP